MIVGPLFLFALPLLAGGVVFLLHRWKTVAALVAIGLVLVLGLAVIALPLGRPVEVLGPREINLGESIVLLGRELVLEPSDRIGLALMYFVTAAILFLAWRSRVYSLLFPVSLGLLAFFGVALLVRPLIYAALFVEIAAALAIFALQPEGQSPAQGSLRYLTFATLALPGLMVTHWLLERFALTPNETGLLTTAAVLLGLSFALLLGVIPFHTWVPAIVEDSMPLAGAYVLTVSNSAVWFLLLDFLETYPWLRGLLGLNTVVLTIGAAMALFGGLLAAGQRRFGRLIGYGALADTGCMLIALGMESRLSAPLIFLAMLARPFGLALMAAGLGGLGGGAGRDDAFETFRSMGWRAPFSSAAFLIGGLSIAGLPVSAGFAWRWALYRDLAAHGQVSAILLLFSSGGVAIGIIRGVAYLFARPRREEIEADDGSLFSEGWLTPIIMLIAIAACMIVGVFPQLTAPIAEHLADAYTFLSY